MMTDSDTEFMNRALTMAGKSSEDVPCGCVIVRDGRVISSAFNSQHADKIAINHAEIKAIVAANYSLGVRELKDATAYCTCEPCAMCLTALSYAKIGRIVYAEKMADVCANDRQATFDSQKFVKSLNFIPKLEQLLL